MTELLPAWSHPVTAIGASLLAYLAGLWLYRLSRHNPLLHPGIIAIGTLIAVLTLFGVPYADYFDGAEALHFLLGPATVALAIPLYQYAGMIRRLMLPIIGGLLAGTVVAITSAVGLAWWLGATEPTLLSLAPKSVTTPIAMGVAEQIGGLASLAAGMVIVTGAIGCMLAPWLYRWLGIKNPATQGLALGVVAHGFGTAKAFELSPAAGAFAALGLGLAGLLVAFTLPFIVALF